jgi:hypothetical protein
MKKKIFIHSVIVSLVLTAISCKNQTGSTSAGQSDSTKTTSSESTAGSTAKKYEIKSGIVNYTSKVMGMENSQVLYFDDYGAKEATFTVTEMKIMGQTMRKVDVTLIKDGFRYTYALENIVNNENKLDKKEIRKSKVYGTASSGMSAAVATMTDAVKKEYDYKDEGKETIAGVTGNKFSMKMGKARMSGVVYKNVMLKTEMEMITITANKFEENAAVPADKFELPKDYKIIETE